MGLSRLLWKLPYLLMQRLGHLDPHRIARMSPGTVAAMDEVQSLPSAVSRDQIAATIVDAATLVSKECDGNAERLFVGTFDEILRRLQRIDGVGVGLARMMVILRMIYFGLEPESGGELLPKLDVHVKRVFVRTRLVKQCNDEEVGEALAGCDPREIGIVDQQVWRLGQDRCHAGEPICRACPLDDICPKHIRRLEQL
jgi:endonuclease III